jgi:hypothetical protein
MNQDTPNHERFRALWIGHEEKTHKVFIEGEKKIINWFKWRVPIQRLVGGFFSF